jgi:predicted nucleic-acid-binding Zn-ribbon protein
MRRTNICPKCQHNEVLFLREVNDETEDTSERWRIARTKTKEKGTFRDKTVVTITGLVQAYVCRRCGYTELYTKAPERIEPDGKSIELIKGPEPEGPYQ